MVRRLQVPGNELDGLHYIRAFGNSDAIRDELEGVEHVVCVGGSYIGCEVAASLTALGKHVTIVMLEDEPLARGFGEHAGRFFRGVLGERGVGVVGGDEVDRFEGEGRVERVVTKGGRELDAQLVVCGVGVTPDVMLAQGARGSSSARAAGSAATRSCARARPASGRPATSASTRASSTTARGSASSTPTTPGTRAPTRRRRCSAPRSPTTSCPYFFSDLADWASLEYVGPARDWDEEVVRGEMESGAFGVWFLEHGRVRGALSVGGGLDLDRARELLRSGERVGVDDLPLSGRRRRPAPRGRRGAQTSLPGMRCCSR